jgi:hypothetical protein
MKPRQQDYITLARGHVQALLAAISALENQSDSGDSIDNEIARLELLKTIRDKSKALKAKQTEWNALAYATATLEGQPNPNYLPTIAELLAEDPPWDDANTRDGIGRAEVGACVFDSANAFVAVFSAIPTTAAISALMSAGHATNLSKLL